MEDLFLAKVDSNGFPDPNFGTNGIIHWGDSAVEDVPLDLYIDANGQATVFARSDSSNGFTAFRFDATGAPDNSFGTNGEIELYPNGPGFGFLEAYPESNGELILASGVGNVEFRPALVRILSDGSPDPGFGTAGIAIDSTLPEIEIIASSIRRPNGKFVFGGSYTGNFRNILTQLKPDASADASFGMGGTVVINRISGYGEEAIFDLLLKNNGKILVVGCEQLFTQAQIAQSNASILQLELDGAIDSSYGYAPPVTYFGLGTQTFSAFHSIQQDAQGDFFLCTSFRGLINNVPISSYALVKLDSTGIQDSSFAGDGVLFAQAPDPQMDESTLQMIVQPDGKLLVAFSTASNETKIVRYGPGIPLGSQGPLENPIQISLSPNPVNSISTLKIDTHFPHSINLSVYHASGKLILDLGERKISQGKTEVPIDLSGLNPGTYLLRINNQAIKLIKI